MGTNYTVSEKLFTQLDRGIQSSDFISINHDRRKTAVLISDVEDGLRHDTLLLTIEPIYQVPKDFPKKIEVTSELYDWSIDPITEPSEINVLLSHFLRTKINLSDDSSQGERDNALFAGFAEALILPK